MLRFTDVDFQLRYSRKKSAAYLRIHLHGIERESLIRTVGLYFKRTALRRNGKYSPVDRFKLGRNFISDAQRVRTEYFGKARNDLVGTFFFKSFNDIPPARTADLVSDAFKRALKVLLEYLFKIAAVVPF